MKSGTANSCSQAYTNRIHEDDCVQVLKHLIEQDIKGEAIEDCYLASDSEPVRMKDLVNWMNEELNMPNASDTPLKSQLNASPSNAGKAQRRAGSKKCCNKRLLESGYEFKYPTFREGYKEMIKRLS